MTKHPEKEDAASSVVTKHPEKEDAKRLMHQMSSISQFNVHDCFLLDS